VRGSALPGRMTARLVARWWWTLAAASLRARLLPRFLIWAMVLVQLDAMANLAEASKLLRALPAWMAGACGAALVALHVVSEARIVRDAVLDERFGVLRRQPLGPWQAGPAVASILSAIALPMGLVGGLWTRSASGALVWGIVTVLPMLM
jgi:hypothetical protein